MAAMVKASARASAAAMVDTEKVSAMERGSVVMVAMVVTGVDLEDTEGE